MAYNSQQFFLQKRGVGYVTPILCTMRGLGESDIEQAVDLHLNGMVMLYGKPLEEEPSKA